MRLSYFPQLTRPNMPQTQTGCGIECNTEGHPIGERRLAEKVVVKAVATACRETIDTMVEPADEAMRVQTPGGVFSVRWDERGSATALGQLAFFAEHLETSGLFEA